MNRYLQLKTKHQEEFNKFPILFAFSDKQFIEGMEKLGLTEQDTDKVVAIGAGGFIRKTDKEQLLEMMERHDDEMNEQIEQDTTGEGFIREMFEYELANHEYSYTLELDDTLDALGLTFDDINQNPALKKGLDLARGRIVG